MFGYLVLTLGGLLFGAMVYRYDMHEREPWWMLVAAACAGALGMWGAFALEDMIEIALRDAGLYFDLAFNKAVLAGVLEELAKLAVPVAVLLFVRRHFNDPMDGLIYGSLAGLGAGLFESAWWQWFDIDQSHGALQESGATVMRLFVHTIWGGIGGSALGLIVMKKPWRAPLARTVALVVLIHFAWDYFVGLVINQQFWHRLVAAGLLGTSIVWYGLLVVRANKWSRSMHAPVSKHRLAGKIVRFLITRRLK